MTTWLRSSPWITPRARVPGRKHARCSYPRQTFHSVRATEMGGTAGRSYRGPRPEKGPIKITLKTLPTNRWIYWTRLVNSSWRIFSAERSFSKLKLIENYVSEEHNDTGPPRWFVKIEHRMQACATKNNVDDVVKTFAAKKSPKAFLNK